MTNHPKLPIRTLVLFGFGVAAGAVGGPTIYTACQPRAHHPSVASGAALAAPPETAAAPDSALQRLRLMKGRCIGGFDGTSNVLDFSGSTQALEGELTFEKGRLAETARGHVTADPATLDTGDADRDKEIRDELLETRKYPEMSFEVTRLEKTGEETADMTGTMEIHGQKREVTIPCSIRLRPDGHAWMKGDVRVKMSSFGIEPPVKLAVIKVDDQIRIWFEVWAEPVEAPRR